MRRTAVLHVLAGVVLASATVLACGGGSAPPRAPTSASGGDPPTSTPVPLIEEAPYIPSDPRITLQVVEGILPSPGATSAALGLVPGAWVLEAGLGGPQDNSDEARLARSGVTAGWIASLPPDASFGVALFFHGTPEDAERTYQFHRRLFGSLSEDERGTIADAVSMGTIAVSPDVPVAASFIMMRQGTVTAIGGMNHDENRDIGAGLREFVRMLALGIDEFVRSQGP